MSASMIGDVAPYGIVPHPAGAWRVDPTKRDWGYQVAIMCICPNIAGIHWHVMHREFSSREEASQAAYDLMPEEWKR